ncbi:hypothetical protein M3J09_002822 [Ascochyta lentis]
MQPIVVSHTATARTQSTSAQFPNSHTITICRGFANLGTPEDVLGSR